MRSIYITTPINPFSNLAGVRRDLCTLNKNVLDWVVPRVLVNIQQHLGFVRDQSNTLHTINQPEWMSSAGTRTNHGFDVGFI